MASILPGRVTGERMAQIRAKSKLREKLEQVVEKAEEQLQIVYEQIDLLRQRRFEIDRQIITYDKRLRLRSEVQDSMAARKLEAEELRERLAVAIHELEDYNDMMESRVPKHQYATTSEDMYRY
jgi:coenzyme F420-reducing hydrogenase alpha subunit